MFMEACGMAIIAGGYLPILAVGLLMLIQYARTEEEETMLRVHFGAEAEQYIQKVPKFNLVAGLYRRLFCA